MGRLVGYMANRSDRLAAALQQERAVVASAPKSEQPTGWGLGFYQGGEVLHKKRPQLQGELDWGQVAKDVVSDCVVMHLRQPTVGDFRTQNTHPFRMRRWLFAHSGTIGRFEAVAEPMRASLPDFLARNIRGTTDSELLFHVVLSFLHDAGQLDANDVDQAAVLTALRSAVALVDRLCAEVRGPESTLNLVLTNGRSMFALRRGIPMAYVERRGLHDPTAEVAPSPSGPASLRYVMVVGNGGEFPADWSVMEDGEVVVVDRDLVVHSHPL